MCSYTGTLIYEMIYYLFKKVQREWNLVFGVRKKKENRKGLSALI